MSKKNRPVVLEVVVRAWSVIAFVALTLGLILWMLAGIVFAAIGTLARKIGGRKPGASRSSRVSESEDRRWHIADWMRA